ncbi:chaperonin 10-like protein [Armillaria mellea]|nr:chaperonin 10-like protein [Armillaria mellea]
MCIKSLSNGEFIGCVLRFDAKGIEKLTPRSFAARERYLLSTAKWILAPRETVAELEEFIDRPTADMISMFATQERKARIWPLSWLPMKGGLLATRATFKSIKAVVPLLDRVLVQRFKPETKTTSGLFLPTSVTATPLPEATVIAVGPGAPNKDGAIVPTQVKAGDRVLLPGWGGNSIKVGDEEYFLFKDAEILAKIQE